MATILKIAVSMFLPILVLFLSSEYLGLSQRVSSDALSQAIYESFRQGSAKGILGTIVVTVMMYLVGNVSWRVADQHLAAATVIPLPKTESAIVCSARSLAGQRFTGAVDNKDIIISIDSAKPTQHGAEIQYSVVYMGDVRTDGRAFFDATTCTVSGIAPLPSGARVVQSGNDLALVATVPRWTLQRYASK